MYINKRIRYLFFLSVVFILFVTSIFAFKKRKSIRAHFKIVNDELMIREDETLTGIFYKGDTANFDDHQNLVHLTLKLNNSKSFRINTDLLKKVPESSDILLTIEFWGNKYLRKYKNDPLLDIINGSLDEKLQRIFDTLLNSDKTIFIRINPEMEVPVYVFPWQNKTNYIEAYRYIALKWKKKNRNLQFVWGPSGHRGAEEFYPGDDVVDFMSITLKSKIESLYTRYPNYPDLKNEIHIKLHRLRYFEKSILILCSERIEEKLIVSNYFNAEIDTIAKYKDQAYKSNLWKNSDSVFQNKKFLIGLHDPSQLLTSNPAISVEHLFVDFGQIQSGDLKGSLKAVSSRNHDAIVTFEPYRDLSGMRDTNVLVHILQGKYDAILKQVFQEVSNSGLTVYLRFAHEMEIPITRYEWQSQDPLTYIRAFRYFMKFAQPFPPNVKKVWGPAGDRGSADFYPGDDVVDYISFAAYALPDKDITDYEKQASFSRIFQSKTRSLKLINKPVFITEFGVKGPEDFQTFWLEDAARILNENPQVIGVSYFNRSDIPGAWGEIKPPDWSITANSLNRFLKVLTRDD